jgi:hypothetical protein
MARVGEPFVRLFLHFSAGVYLLVVDQGKRVRESPQRQGEALAQQNGQSGEMAPGEPQREESCLPKTRRGQAQRIRLEPPQTSRISSSVEVVVGRPKVRE